MTNVQQTGSIDLKAQTNAAQTATNYITQVDSNGIFISPSNQSPTANSPGNSTLVNGDGMEIFNEGISLAKFGTNVRIGQTTDNYLYLDNMGLNVMIPQQGNASLIGEFSRFGNTNRHFAFSPSSMVFRNNDKTVMRIDSNAGYKHLFYESFNSGSNDVNSYTIEPTKNVVNNSSFSLNCSIYIHNNSQSQQLVYEIPVNKWINTTWEKTYNFETGSPLSITLIFEINTTNNCIYITTTASPCFQVAASMSYLSNDSMPLALNLYDGNGDSDLNIITHLGPDGAQIGKVSESHMELDYHSMQLIDKEGNTYFHVSDLRSSGASTISVTDEFTGNGTRKNFIPSCRPYGSISVKVDGTSYTENVQYTVPTSNYLIGFALIQMKSVLFDNNAIPPAGASVKLTYQTDDDPKAFTFGTRGSGATGPASYSVGFNNTASGTGASASGFYSVAKGMFSHAEGSSKALAELSHAQNSGTIAASPNQTTLGRYNVEDANNVYAVIIGNGTADTARSNALAIDWDGAVDMWNPHIDMTTAPSSSVYNRIVEVFDKNGDPVGWLQVSQSTNGSHAVVIGASNSDDSAQNQLHLGYDASDNPTAWVSEPTVLRKALGALAAGDFAVEEVSTHSSVSISAGSNSYKNGTKSKTGYYPLGIVSTYTSDFRCPIAYANLTSQASGSAGWAVNIGNWSSSSRTVNANIKILWVKE